jgi:hypothetical protein
MVMKTAFHRHSYRTAWAVFAALLLAVLIAPLHSAQAQGSTPIVITTLIAPPYDPDLSVWERNPNRVLVSLRNTSTTETFNVRIGGYAESTDGGGVRIEIRNDYPTAAITLAPGATVQLNARQTNLFEQDAVRVTGADRDEIARTRRLPEGSYRICLQVLDFTTLTPLSAGEPSGCSSFDIRAGELPRLVQPYCESTVTPTTPQLVLLQWTRPALNVPATAIANLRYTLVIVPIIGDRTPEQAIESASDPIFFREQNITTNFFQYGPLHPRLDTGQRYAWRVGVSDPVGGTQFENDGWSEACWFLYGDTTETESGDGDDEDCETPRVAKVFPAGGDATPLVLPYRHVPAVAGYDPFCPNLKGFSSTFNVRRSGGSVVESYTRSYTSQGLLDSLRARYSGEVPPDSVLLTDQVVTNASNFLLSRPTTSGATPLPPGVPLEWQAAVTTRTPDNTDRQSSMSGQFSVGMQASIPQFPGDGRRIRPDSLHFSFQTSPTLPDSLLAPVVDIISAERSRGVTVMSTIPVREVWMLEVARTPFSSGAEIVYSTFGTVSANVSLNGTIDSTVSSAIYRSISTGNGEFTQTEEGEYYWRVKWLVNNIAAAPRSLTTSDTAAYAWSPVRRFVLDSLAEGGEGITGTECLRITSTVPVNGGAWSESLKPRFAVQVEPSIDSTKISGGRLQIWQLTTQAQQSNPSSVLNTPATFDRSFTGDVRSSNTITARVDSLGRLLYDLKHVNYSGAPNVFVGTNGARYAWRFTLRFTGSTIRTDSVTCTRDSVYSSLGTFSLNASIATVSDTACLILSPAAPAFGAKIREERPRFALTATPAIDTSKITGGRLRRYTTDAGVRSVIHRSWHR